MKYTASLSAALFALSLVGCNQSPRTPDPEPTETEGADEPEAQATASIFTPEADIEDAPEVLVPLEETVSFPEGGADFDQAASDTLERIIASEQLGRGQAIVLRGHSDSAGTDAANIRASQRRAEAVRDWLVEKGVSASRIRVIAFGEQNPAAPNALPDGTPNEEGRAQNRRVDVTVTIGNDVAATGDKPVEE